MTNYKERYGNELGACVSCKHICSREYLGEEYYYIKYNGSKYAYCKKYPATSIIMLDEPNVDLPINTCWEAVK